MRSIELPELSLPTAVTALTVAPESTATFRIDVVVDLSTGGYQLVNDLETTDPSILLLDDQTIGCRPDSRSRPFLCRLEIRAPFAFNESPVRWGVGETRPAWIGDARLSEKGHVVSMLIVNATHDQQVTQFELVPAQPARRVIDPTIVNNPPD